MCLGFFFKKKSINFFLLIFFFFFWFFFQRWGLISFLVYSCFSLAGHAEKYWLVAFNISIIIAFGVLALSILKCDLLSEALRDLGGSFYLLGNFAVHYYPPLRLWYSKPEYTKVAKQITFSLVWIVTYLASQKASSVYGCRISDRTILISSLLCIPLTILVYFAAETREVKDRVYNNFRFLKPDNVKAIFNNKFLFGDYE